MAAGYPGTPKGRKLGLEPGQHVVLDRAPPGWTLTDPPADLQLTITPARGVEPSGGEPGGEPDEGGAAIDDDWSALRLVWHLTNRR